MKVTQFGYDNLVKELIKLEIEAKNINTRIDEIIEHLDEAEIIESK